jgi:hypothetical protein
MNRPRTAWFCFTFVVNLCGLAFIAGFLAGLFIASRFVPRPSPKPVPRATATVREIPEPTPRVRTKAEPEVFSF